MDIRRLAVIGLLLAGLTACAPEPPSFVGKAPAEFGYLDRLKAVSPASIKRDPDGSVVKLVLTHVEFTGTEFEEIAGLSRLGGLLLGGTNVRDADMVHFRGLAQLITIGLRDTEVTNAGLDHLAGLKGLKNLYLARTGVTDGGLERVARLESLTALGLRGTAVTDAGLKYLENMTSLEYLNIEETAITDAGVETLQTALPDLTITR